MVLLNFVMIPAFLLSIVSLILLIVGIIKKNDMLKSVCGTILLTTPDLIYFILLFNFFGDVLKLPYQIASTLSLLILITVVVLLLIKIWRKK
jgi:hypothetical protein